MPCYQLGFLKVTDQTGQTVLSLCTDKPEYTALMFTQGGSLATKPDLVNNWSFCLLQTLFTIVDTLFSSLK